MFYLYLDSIKKKEFYVEFLYEKILPPIYYDMHNLEYKNDKCM